MNSQRVERVSVGRTCKFGGRGLEARTSDDTRRQGIVNRFIDVHLSLLAMNLSSMSPKPLPYLEPSNTARTLGT